MALKGLLFLSYCSSHFGCLPFLLSVQIQAKFVAVTQTSGNTHSEYSVNSGHSASDNYARAVDPPPPSITQQNDFRHIFNP